MYCSVSAELDHLWIQDFMDLLCEGMSSERPPLSAFMRRWLLDFLLAGCLCRIAHAGALSFVAGLAGQYGTPVNGRVMLLDILDRVLSSIYSHSGFSWSSVTARFKPLDALIFRSRNVVRVRVQAMFFRVKMHLILRLLASFSNVLLV